MDGHQTGGVAYELTAASVRNEFSPAPVDEGDSESVHPTLSDLTTAIFDDKWTLFRPIGDYDESFFDSMDEQRLS